MTLPPPDEQLRQLLARHDQLLSETARQNRDLHEWAVRFGPRPFPMAQAPNPQAAPAAAARTGVPPMPGSPLPPWGPPGRPTPQGAGPLPPSPNFLPPVMPGPPPVLRPGLPRAQLVSRFVAGAGALVTLVGVAFILVLAAQNGYFGPAPRTISAAVLGAVLSAGAFLLHRRDPDNAGGPALLATGMAAGFLSLVAATTLYDLVPSAAGLALAGLLGIAVSVVAALWRSQWLACLAIAAALVIGPWVSGDVHVGAAFMVVLSGVAGIAHLRVRWPVFHVARTLPTSFLLTYLMLSGGLNADDLWMLLALSGIHAGLGILSTLLGRRASDGEQWALAMVLISSALPLLLLPAADFRRFQGGWAVDVVAAALYVLVALFPGTRDWVKGTGVAVAGVFAVQALALGTNLDVGFVLLPGLAAGYMATAAAMRSRAVGLVACLGSVVALVPWLLGVGLPNGLGLSFGDYLIGSLLVVLLALFTQGAAHRILEASTPAWLRYVLIVVGLVGFGAAVTSAGFLIGTSLGSATSIEQASSVVVTVGWALASVVSLQRPLRSADRSTGWVRLGLVLAVVAVAKLFFVDLAVLPGLARGLAFLLVGLLLLVLGISYAKAYERARVSVPSAVPADTSPQSDEAWGSPTQPSPPLVRPSPPSSTPQG